MSETTTETDGTEPTTETSDGAEDTFSRSYVTELRDESAKHRTRAKTATERLVTAYAASTGRLVDPSDLHASDDLNGEDGLPDPAKITEAVESLIKAKPHLAKIRPVGDIGQGHQGASGDSGAATFASLLRGVAS